jgi:hypothetical protein
MVDDGDFDLADAFCETQGIGVARRHGAGLAMDSQVRLFAKALHSPVATRAFRYIVAAAADLVTPVLDHL